MEWFDSWVFVAAVLWVVASVFVVAIVAINPPEHEDQLIKDWLREGRHHGSRDGALGPVSVLRS